MTVLLIGFFDGLARRRRRRPGSDPDAKADADADADELSELDELDTIPENERMREPAYRSRTASDETATA
ncbi:hypothetical protein [Cryobacterium sp. PAMC25264]|uniref:hypothetical protein n=1 Tax=Cryobacterium sp. PAMC25264 TaxID=2861288 RepID=UPI001C636C1C|nr:hypothetical protein [Cryobacterium sp. PAMC25264]QYF72831.1 hypothetical protein KY500_13750 [Cryobacterium sp. PAMC25264]